MLLNRWPDPRYMAYWKSGSMLKVKCLMTRLEPLPGTCPGVVSTPSWTIWFIEAIAGMVRHLYLCNSQLIQLHVGKPLHAVDKRWLWQRHGALQHATNH